MTVRALLPLLTLASLICGCGLGERTAREHFGAAELDIISGATRADAYRIDSGGNPYPFKITSAAIPLGDKELAELKRALTRDETYRQSAAAACGPRPGVLFRFVKEIEAADVLICYECMKLGIAKTGVAPKWDNCSAIGDLLIDIAVAAFPNDKKIQELKH